MVQRDNHVKPALSRRRVLDLVGTSLVAATLPKVISGASAQGGNVVEGGGTEGRLTVYGDSSMVPQMVAGFAKRYTDIRVTSVPGGGWQSYNRFAVEKGAGRVLADIVWANDDTLLTGFNAKQFATVDYGAKYPADAVPPDSGYVIAQRMLTPFIYNTQASSGLPMPQDWEDLAHLGPEWEGQILTADPRNSGTALCVLTALYQTIGKERTDAILSGLRKSGAEIAPNTGVQVQKLMSGEKALSVTMHMAFYKSMKDNGAPVGFLLPASGSVMQVGAFGIPSEAPHPKAARLFIDFTMSEDGARIMAANGTYPGGSDNIAPDGFPARRSIKVIGGGPAEAIRDRDRVIEWWKQAMGVS